MPIEDERKAFEALLPNLLKQHPGKFALIHDRKLLDVFDDFASAYAQGLDIVGLDVPFLVSEIQEEFPRPVSLSWSAGVMFG